MSILNKYGAILHLFFCQSLNKDMLACEQVYSFILSENCNCHHNYNKFVSLKAKQNVLSTILIHMKIICEIAKCYIILSVKSLFNEFLLFSVKNIYSWEIYVAYFAAICFRLFFKDVVKFCLFCLRI